MGKLTMNFRVIVFVFLCSGILASTNPLYLIEEVVDSNTFNIIQVDVVSNSTSVIFSFPMTVSGATVMGSTFDQQNNLYYLVYNLLYHSYVFAVDVVQKEIALSPIVMSPIPTLWGIDIDSKGHIHFLRPHSRSSRGKVLVDHCSWDPEAQQITVLVPQATSVNPYGTIALVEEFGELIILSGSIMTTIGLNGHTTSFPKASNIGEQNYIEWNNVTNIGYLYQSTQGSLQPVIAQYKKLTSTYPQVCELNLGPGNDLGYQVLLSTVDATALDPYNNYFSIVVQDAKVGGMQQTKNGVLTVDLNTCQEYFTLVPFTSGSFSAISSPVYSFYS